MERNKEMESYNFQMDQNIMDFGKMIKRKELEYIHQEMEKVLLDYGITIKEVLCNYEKLLQVNKYINL